MREFFIIYCIEKKIIDSFFILCFNGPLKRSGIFNSMLFEKNKRVPNKRNQKDKRYRYNHQKFKAFISREKFKKSRHIQKKTRKSKKSTRK